MLALVASPSVPRIAAEESSLPFGFMVGAAAGEERDFAGISFVWCPPGEFAMGSPEKEPMRQLDETRHQVVVELGFWMAKTETTQKQWTRIFRHHGTSYRGEHLPVDLISWNDAVAWMNEMNRRFPLPEGWKWSLPTEIQWEYACRAGTETPFSFGNVADGTQANCFGQFPYGTKKKGPSLGRLVEVALYPSNPWGLHDMHGNVDELCANRYASYPLDEALDPDVHDVTAAKGLRGGRFSSIPAGCRSASRFQAPPDHGCYGFRPAIVPPQDAPPHSEVSSQLELTPEPENRQLWPPYEKPSLPAGSLLDGLAPAEPLSEVFGEFQERLVGERRRHGNIVLIWCPPGNFSMGEPHTEPASLVSFYRQHEVTLTHGFWMAETETTQKQWEEIMGSNPGDIPGESHPVEQVRQIDCLKWIAEMNRRHPLPKGWAWSLPTEAQWEYACRAGSRTAFSFGDSLNGDKANCNGYMPLGTTVRGRCIGRTTVVASYPPNAWGLCDMHGNVWEWCAGEMKEYPETAVIDPAPKHSTTSAALRGGSWKMFAPFSRSASRFSGVPALTKADDIGFRAAIVRTK